MSLSTRIVSCTFAAEGFNAGLTTALAYCSGEISGLSDVSTTSEAMDERRFQLLPDYFKNVQEQKWSGLCLR